MSEPWELARVRAAKPWREFTRHQALETVVHEIEATASAMRQLALLDQHDPLAMGDHYRQLMIRCYAAAMLSDQEIEERVRSGGG